MSNVPQGAFALVPSESNFGGLTKRLLALRAEIDAILAELASQAVATPRGEAMVAQPAPALTPPAEEPADAVEQQLLPVLPNLLADSESNLERCGAAEKAEAAPEPGVREIEVGQFLEPSEMVGAAASEQPVADPMALEPSEGEQDPRYCAVPALEDLTQIAAIGTNAAERATDASPFPEAEVSPTADAAHAISATEVVAAEQQGDATMLVAPQQSAPESATQVDRGPSAADVPQAGDRPITTTADADEALADAAVISLHARQRKHKGGLATGAPMPMRSSRRLAAKIAACILVLLTAATVLVMADRNAFGSVQSFPWMTQTPSAPTGIEWLLQRLKADAAQSSHEAAPSADLPLDDGPLAGRVAWGA